MNFMQYAAGLILVIIFPIYLTDIVLQTIAVPPPPKKKIKTKI